MEVERFVGKDTALKIYCAMLARDPLPQQRFQDLSNRLALLASLACEAAYQFEALHKQFMQTRESAMGSWDQQVAPLAKDKRTEEFIRSLKDIEATLPKAQLDLVDQVKR